MRKIKYRSYEDARKFVRSLKLSGQKEWQKYRKSDKRPKDIPGHAEVVYKNEWIGIRDWLGTSNVQGRLMHAQFKSFNESRKFAQSLKLSRQKDWNKYCKSGKKPTDISANPARTYKDEFTSWGDFLGTGNLSPSDKRKQMRSYEECKKFVRSLGIKSEYQWVHWLKNNKKPDDIPVKFSLTYPKEYTTAGEFFGTGIISVKKRNYLTWKEAKPIYRKLAKEYGLKNGTDWMEFAKMHKKLLEDLRIPRAPHEVYTKERVWRKMK
jgi:hypothetical protein